jgi:hypothetical protein
MSASPLGGGVQGVRHGVGFANTMDGSSVAMKRKLLRKAFGSNIVKYVDNSNVQQTLGPSMCGPFRTAMKMGDSLSRKYQSCGGCNQVNDANGHVFRSKMIDSVSNKSCGTLTNGVTPTQVPLAVCNTKYVSDSSLYTNFKTLSAINLTYNDLSFGGDCSNGSYSFLNAVRRR